MFPIPVNQYSNQRMAIVDFHISIGAEHHLPGIVQVTQHIMQQGQRAAVNPMQIVEKLQQSAIYSERLEETLHVVEETQAFLVG